MIMVSRRTLRAKRVDTIGDGVEMNRNERVSILAASDGWSKIEIDRIRQHSRHHDLHALRMEKLLCLESDRQRRVRLLEACRSGSARGGMAGIDGDGQAAERRDRIY